MKNFMLSLIFVAGLFSPTSVYAGLDQFEMLWFNGRFYTCGRGYQIGNVATNAKTRNRLPNYKFFLLEFAEYLGASEAQLEELGQIYEDGRERSKQEGFVQELELDDIETKIAMVLFPMMNEYCELEKSDFADKVE